jgi:hypothetical protein
LIFTLFALLLFFVFNAKHTFLSREKYGFPTPISSTWRPCHCFLSL